MWGVPVSSSYSRRDFMNTLTMSLLAAGLSGCGSSSGNETGFGGGQSPSGNSTQVNALQGRVLLQGFGAGPFTIQTVQKTSAVVGADGTFATAVTALQVPQLVFLTGPAVQPRQQNRVELSSFFPGPLKGLGLYIPGASEAFELSLNSTAVALVFLSFGILTTDLSEALTRIRRILGLRSFSGLVSGLAQFLTNGSLEDAGNSKSFLALKQACVDEFFSQSQNKLDQHEFNQLIPQGLLRTQKGGVDAQNRQTIGFENHGFRFVSVIRQELNGNGESVPHVKPRLVGANVGGSTTNSLNVNGILGGGNALGWGNLFTGQTEDPGLGEDIFAPASATTRVRYWAMGAGGGDAAASLPAEIQLSEFGPLANTLTAFYYLLLPLFDLVSGGVVGVAIHKLGPKFFTHDSVHNLEETADLALGVTGLGLANDQLVGSYKTANEGNITSGWLDVLAAVISVVSGVGLTVYEALLTETIAAASAEGVFSLGALAVSTEIAATGLLLISGILAVGGLSFALFNLSRMIRDQIRLPALTPLTVVLRTTPYDLVVCPVINQDPISNSELVIAKGFNDSSDVLITAILEVDGNNDWVWRPLLGGVVDPDRAQIGPLPNSQINNPQSNGYINNRGTILYLGYIQLPGGFSRYLTMVQQNFTGAPREVTDPAFGDRALPVPWSLNELNQFAGTLVDRAQSSTDRGVPFIYDLDAQTLTIIDIATKLQIPGAVAAFLDINDAGYVVGAVFAGVDSSDGFLGLFVYKPDGATRLLPVPNLTSSAVHINNQLHIFYASDSVGRIVDLDGNLIHQLQIPGPASAAVFARGCFNDLDQTVGMVYVVQQGPALPGRTILWEADGNPTDLTDSWPTVNDGGQEFSRFSVQQINNAGVILGYFAEARNDGFISTQALAKPRS